MNKCDLDQEKKVFEYRKIYESCGYKFVETSALSNVGVDRLKTYLVDKISVFSGPSGVGKSSLLNDIQEGLKLETGAVSEKIGRGKHTTRHSELIRLHEGGFIVDTPGFTSLEVDFIDRYELASCFPDFYYKGIDACRFHNCLHLNEPGCMVKEGVEDGSIAKSRYESYKHFMEACTEKENRRY